MDFALTCMICCMNHESMLQKLRRKITQLSRSHSELEPVYSRLTSKEYVQKIRSDGSGLYM